MPAGDVIEADIPREAANEIVDALIALGVQEQGSIQLLPVGTWISRTGLAAEHRAPGEGADAVVWSEVIERAYSESRLTWTFITLHGAGDAARRHRHRHRLRDPRHRRDGARP